jgi:sugar lactone lactonase YvrE
MRKPYLYAVWALALLAAACGTDHPASKQPATITSAETTAATTPELEPVFADSTYQLTGVAAAADGRVFVNYPYWLDKHSNSVVEVGPDGKAKPYPDATWNSFKKGDDGTNKFVCVQAVVADDKGFLWVVDPAGIGLSKVYQKSNKVVQIDLKTNQVKRIYRFSESVAGADSYLNDIRVDNQQGFAYITSSSKGGIVVLNLTTGTARLVLQPHYSTQSDTAYHFRMNGKELANAQGPAKINSDGIALTPDKAWLYYKPLTDNKLYRVSTEVLRDFKTSEQQVEQRVEDLGKFGTTDGMEFDAAGNLYLGDLEKSSIVKISPDKQVTTLVTDPVKLSWPDSYSVSPDGYLYISCSQIQNMPWFNSGQSLTKLPYQVFRLKVK